MGTRASAWGETGIMGMLPREPRLPTEPEQSEVALIYAISYLLAAHAEQGKMPNVSAPSQFRAAVLADQPGNLLAPKHIARWIEEQSIKDGEPSWRLDGLAVQPEQLEEQADGAVHIRDLRFYATKIDTFLPMTMDKLERFGRQATLRHQYIWYRTLEFPSERRPVRSGGTLDALRHLSLELSYACGWGSDQATAFVLTGMVPVLTGTITGPDATPLMLPDEYAALAMLKKGDRQEGRTQGDGIDWEVRGRRAREMSVKHLELAVFTAWHEGETLAARMAEWNAKHPEWSYRQVTNFGRDSREGHRRLWERMEAYTVDIASRKYDFLR